MRIHRTAPTRAFSTFANALIRDLTISWCAAGVLMYLLSLPNGAHASIRSLAKLRKEGRDRIADALRELERSHYLRRLTVKNPESGQITTEYEVFDRPFDQPTTPEEEFVNEAGWNPASGVPDDGGTGSHPPGVKTLVKEPPTLSPPEPPPAPAAAEPPPAPAAPESPPNPEPAPASLGSAVRLLLSLRETDARLTLGAAEALRLAPLVEEWRAVGAGDATLRAALTGGLPTPLHSPGALLENRLRRKKPAPTPVAAPAPPPPARRAECDECRAPIPSPGCCRTCRTGGDPVRIAEVQGFIDAAARGASAVRAVLSAA